MIDAVVIDGDGVRLRLAEIAENLHRAELTALERDELTAEWIALTERIRRFCVNLTQNLRAAALKEAFAPQHAS